MSCPSPCRPISRRLWRLISSIFSARCRALWRWVIGATSYNDYRFFDMRSLPGAIIVISLVLFPYVYVSCRLLFAHGGRNVIDAARILGARGFSLFFRIGVPLAWPALISGLVLVVLETLNDIGATEHLGVSSLSVVIRDLWLNRGDLPAAARMAGLLIGVVALLLFLDRSHRHRKNGHARTVAQPRAIRLSGAAAWFATLATGMPVVLGFLIPTGFLLWRALLYAGQQTLDSAFFSAALSSLVLALAVSFTVMTLGALLTVAIRIAPKLSPAGRIAAFGYAVPGTVLVLAVFPVLRTTDDLLAASGSSWALSGTFAAVVFALVVRFIGIGAGQAQLALRRLPASIDWVARVHGMRRSEARVSGASAGDDARPDARRHPCLHRYGEGTAGNAAAAPAQFRNAGDARLCRSQCGHLRACRTQFAGYSGVQRLRGAACWREGDKVSSPLAEAADSRASAYCCAT